MDEKCWNRLFLMIFYLLAIYLFDETVKISESLIRIIRFGLSNWYPGSGVVLDCIDS